MICGEKLSQYFIQCIRSMHSLVKILTKEPNASLSCRTAGAASARSRIEDLASCALAATPRWWSAAIRSLLPEGGSWQKCGMALPWHKGPSSEGAVGCFYFAWLPHEWAATNASPHAKEAGRCSGTGWFICRVWRCWVALAMAGDLHLQDLRRFSPGGCGRGLCCVVVQGPAAVCEEEQHKESSTTSFAPLLL